MTIPGVPTFYNGTQFRSRLESRWAAFADMAGWGWVYEPFDGDGYLPDFCFTIGARNLLVEVKPVATTDDAETYLPKILAGIAQMWESDLIICGINPLRTLYVDFLNGPEDWNANTATFTDCDHCHNSLNLHPSNVSYNCFQTDCGRYNKPMPGAQDGYIDMLWRKAGNDTRWMPAA